MNTWPMAVAVVLGLSLTLTGCRTGGLDVSGIKNTFGPAGRDAKFLAESAARRADPSAVVEGSDDFDAAQKLYDDGKFTEAESKFRRVVKKYKDKPIEEDALFMIAESLYQQKKYPAAQDAYDELMKKYSSTRHVDQSTRRLFAIANQWLNSPAAAKEVELAQFENDRSPHEIDRNMPVPAGFSLMPNFFDRTKPAFDTPGNALRALKSIWLNDPTGDLADDALMMTATHYLRRRDYQEADRYFAIIRQEYPRSEHVQASYVLGSHAKLMAYQGAGYDGQTLMDAGELVESTIRLYPEAPQKKQLGRELKEIRLQAAARDWEKVQFYMRRGQPHSAAVYADMIINNFSDTSYAEEAKKLLQRLGPEYEHKSTADNRRGLGRGPVDDEAESGDDVETVSPVRSASATRGADASRRRR